MAFVGGAAGIGSLLSGVASVASGVFGFMQAQHQAKLAKMNEQIATENAERARHRAQVEQQDQDAMTRAMIGEQIATQSASGLSVGGRSQLLTRKSAAELGRKDALNVRQAGEVEAHNQLVQAANFRGDARAASLSGASSLVGGFLGGAKSLVGGSTGMRRPSSFRDPWAGLRVVT